MCLICTAACPGRRELRLVIEVWFCELDGFSDRISLELSKFLEFGECNTCHNPFTLNLYIL